MDLDKCASRSSVQTSKIKKIPAYSLLPYAESIAWQLWFFVQICFLFNPSLKFKSPISLLDSTIKKSWLIKCSQAKSSEDFEKNALFKFQFFYYGSWQIWKPLNRVKTSKIKKIQAYSLLLLTENIAWQLWFVVQFCFLFNSSLKFKSPISLLDSTIKKSWLIKCSQAKSSEDFEKNALSKFQLVYYGSWQIWKPLNRVQTSKKKFQRTLYCLWLKTLRDNYDLLYNFVSHSTLSWKLRAQFLF